MRVQLALRTNFIQLLQFYLFFTVQILAIAFVSCPIFLNIIMNMKPVCIYVKEQETNKKKFCRKKFRILLLDIWLWLFMVPFEVFIL